ncbi:hypothetical protein V502_00536 [Pseudogymnoascus sp. VKM F-4520 (FW-2644)]|nr:hypothetical protein V502_00536 [Pseudogymnoascus sp. VKM F-4520 (FW-2644)]
MKLIYIVTAFALSAAAAPVESSNNNENISWYRRRVRPSLAPRPRAALAIHAVRARVFRVTVLAQDTVIC